MIQLQPHSAVLGLQMFMPKLLPWKADQIREKQIAIQRTQAWVPALVACSHRY